MTVGLLLVLLSANELFALAPSTQASNIAFSNVTANSVRVVFTRGDGDSRILVFRAGSSTPANPTDGQAYSGATSNFNSSPANTAAGSIVVYQGTSRAINVSGLTAGTEYTVKVFERRSAHEYLLVDASANPRSFFTNPAPPATIGAGAHNATHTQFDANWTDPASGGWDGFQITVSTVNTFASALNWYSNMELGDVNTLLVEDINTAPADDILPNTVYYYRVRTMQDSRLSAWASYTAGVTTLPENPTVSPVTATICYGETHIVIPTAPNPGNGVEQNKFYAYDAVTGGNRVWGYPLLEIDLTPLTPGTHNYWIATVSNKTGLESAARVQVTVTAYAPGPVADAGEDQVICGVADPYSATLDANAATPATGTWTQISGPATVSFANVNLANTTVPLTAYGTYVFRWTITQNSCATTYDEMSLTLTEPPTEALAGLDIDICGSLSTTLSANTPSAGTGLWSYTTNGTGTLSFSPSASDPNATVTATEAGVYQLVWTISNGTCTPSFDEIVVTFDATPTTAAAGTDIDQCGTTSVNLLANTPVVGTGFWSQTSGIYTATFVDATDQIGRAHV